MGLDTIELIMEVEEHFGITISDEQASGVYTVGDLNELVRSRVERRSSEVCFSLPAFLKVRRAVRELFDNDQMRVRPSTRFEDVIPKAKRRKFWRQLKELLGTAAPPLQRSRPLTVFLCLISLVALILGASAAVIDFAILPLSLFFAVGVIVCCVVLTEPLRLYPPPHFATLGHATQKLVGLTLATNKEVQVADVENELRKIIVEQCGVDADEVVPSANFMKDLNF